MASFYPASQGNGERELEPGNRIGILPIGARGSFWRSSRSLLIVAGLLVPSAVVVHFSLARDSAGSATGRLSTALEAPGTLLQDAIRAEAKEPARALQLYEQARGDALTLQDFTVAATAMRQAGLLTYRMQSGHFEQARQLLSDARQLDLEHRLYENVCQDNLALAWLLVERNRPEDRKQAIVLYEEVEHFGESVEGIDPLLVSTAEVGIGRQLRDIRGDVAGSIKAYRSAQGYYRSVNDQGRVLDTEDRLGSRHLDQRAYASARRSFQETAIGWAGFGDKEWALLTGAVRAQRSKMRSLLVDMTELEDVYDRLPPSSETVVRPGELTARLGELQTKLRSFEVDTQKVLPASDRWTLRWMSENVNRMLRTGGGPAFEQRVDALIEAVRPVRSEAGELANRDRSDEDAFRAAYLKAMYLWDAGSREQAVRTAGWALDDFFERPFCTIDVLRVRRDRLVSLIREHNRDYTPAEGCR